ncbi:MAG: transcriptional regulator [Gammaproteobacteria bacterium]|nr:MAG: transcriptional regulator [Gammaproteobacteria bacterium]
MHPLAIGDALFTKTQQRVLGLLFGKPDQSFYTNKIVRKADMGRGTVSRELERLVNAGLITLRREGNQNHYQANPDSPIYSELLVITRKTFGIADVIRAALLPEEESIQLAFVYGSVASSSDIKTSDLDLMLVGNGLVYGEVMELILPLEETLQRPINPTIYTPREFSSRLRKKSNFLARVMEQPKLMIKGMINDFREPSQNKSTPQ